MFAYSFIDSGQWTTPNVPVVCKNVGPKRKCPCHSTTRGEGSIYFWKVTYCCRQMPTNEDTADRPWHGVEWTISSNKIFGWVQCKCLGSLASQGQQDFLSTIWLGPVWLWRQGHPRWVTTAAQTISSQRVSWLEGIDQWSLYLDENDGLQVN